MTSKHLVDTYIKEYRNRMAGSSVWRGRPFELTSIKSASAKEIQKQSREHWPKVSYKGHPIHPDGGSNSYYDQLWELQSQYEQGMKERRSENWDEMGEMWKIKWMEEWFKHRGKPIPKPGTEEHWGQYSDEENKEWYMSEIGDGIGEVYTGYIPRTQKFVAGFDGDVGVGDWPGATVMHLSFEGGKLKVLNDPYDETYGVMFYPKIHQIIKRQYGPIADLRLS